MSARSDIGACEQAELVAAYALRVLPAAEVVALEAHMEQCSQCRHEFERLCPIVATFDNWSTDVLRPSTALWDRVVERIEERERQPLAGPAPRWIEPEWEEVAPGISCKMLSSDPQADRVSMLVRLAPGVEYPPHSHAGTEELHLLQGELWIDDRKLYPGDYNRAEQGTSDRRVWSETGCTCVLITSPSDVLR
jgi:anti-sigma factor ChrR (cupin superfamily)